MAISQLGEGLSVVISCSHVPHHDWMSFLTWYSLSKNLPDANVVVACSRGGEMNYDIFNWPRRCNVQLLFHKPSTDLEIIDFCLGNKKSKVNLPLLFLTPETVCLRDFDEAGYNTDFFEKNPKHFIKEDKNLVCDCREENPTVFTDYEKGWGKFVTSSWINKPSTPLLTGVSYGGSVMSVNELKMARLWDSAALMYQSVSRG